MENFEDIQDAIKSDLTSASIEQTDEAYIGGTDWNGAEREAYARRNDLYGDILENYIDINKSKADRNKTYKVWFFVVSMVIFTVLTLGPIAIFIIIACKQHTDIADAVAVLGGISGIITSIITIPKIIAQHLFPTDEDIHMIEMVKNMQINDSRIRAAYKGSSDKHK